MNNNSPHKVLIEKINHTIKQPANFRNIYFSRAELADIVGIGESQLSRVLNNEMNTDFHTLINSQRARYAHKVLQAESHINETLEEIGFFCGFKSRITFHRHFTSLYGITPGEFRKK